MRPKSQQINSSNNNQTNRNIENSRQNIQGSQTSNHRNNMDSLFRDFIKILIIKELLSRNQCQKQTMGYNLPIAGYMPYHNNLIF